MKNKMLFEINNNFSILNNLKGMDIAYCLSKNKKLITNEIEHIRSGVKTSEKFTEYENKRIELCKNYGKKDEKGNSIVKNGEYEIKNIDEFKKELEVIQKEYKNEIEENLKKQKDFKEFLEKECTLTFNQLDKKHVPADINVEQMGVLMNFLKE